MSNEQLPSEILVNALRLLRDNAYVTYCKLGGTELCMGEAWYLEHGRFDKTRLDAHTARAEWIGRYRAYQQVLELVERGPQA